MNLKKPMLKPSLLASLGALLLATVSAGETSPPGETKDTLAVVDGRRITADQFKDEWARSGAAGARRSGGFEPLEARLEEMVRFEMLYSAATNAGYDSTPEIREAVRRLIVDRYIEDVLLPQLAAVEFGDDEVEAYFRDHAADFTEPAAYRGAVVQVTIPPTASAEGRAKLRQRVEDARSEALALGPEVETFGSVAVKHSDDQATRYRGGEMGWIADGDTATRWEEPVIGALTGLQQPGEISRVIETESGYYVVKLVDRRAERVRDLAEVRNRVNHAVHQEKVHRVKQDLFDRLAGQVELEVYPQRLRLLPELAEVATVKPPTNPN